MDASCQIYVTAELSGIAFLCSISEVCEGEEVYLETTEEYAIECSCDSSQKQCSSEYYDYDAWKYVTTIECVDNCSNCGNKDKVNG